MDKSQKDKLDRSQLIRYVYSEDHVESEGDKYIGEMFNGAKNGYGILIYANGNKYLGEFESNEFCGEGIFYFSNGDTLQGTFNRGLLNGLGRFKSKDGYEYYGYWLDGRKNGWGRMRNQSVWTYNSETYVPETYDGYWLDDLFHGEGLYENDEVRYYGSFVNGFKSGYGKLINKQLESKYEGNFSNDLFEGAGDLIFHDKSSYSGKFKNNMPNGRGFYRDINNIKHVGEWIDGYCEELIIEYISDFIDKNYSNEFENIKLLRIEWDKLIEDWGKISIFLSSENNEYLIFKNKMKSKLNELDTFLAEFDELMEEEIDSKINNYSGDNNLYYCCDQPKLWEGVHDPYLALQGSIYYKERGILFKYYSLVSEELGDHLE